MTEDEAKELRMLLKMKLRDVTPEMHKRLIVLVQKSLGDCGMKK